MLRPAATPHFYEHVARAILSTSNAAAFFPIFMSFQRNQILLATMVAFAALSSATMHAVESHHSVLRKGSAASPAVAAWLLFADRAAAAALTVYLALLWAAAAFPLIPIILGLAAFCLVGLAELATDLRTYVALHSAWHVAAFALAALVIGGT
jgi:hypothetical protein